MKTSESADRTWVLAMLAGWTLLRLVWINLFELSGDEAYYWLWSNHLDWNYFSKGPGIAWTMALSTGLFGDTAFAIRLPTVFLAAGTGWGLFCLGRDLFSSRVGLWTVIVASLIPLFALGGLLMTIDPLSVFFWVWTLWAAWRLRDSSRPILWLGPGLLIGIGALCKYTNVALIPSLGLFLLMNRPVSPGKRAAAFAMMTVSALLMLVPSVVWMAHHDWITLHHLQARGSLNEPFQIQPGQWMEFIGTQSIIVFPVFFIAFWFVLAQSRKLIEVRARHFLLCAFVPLFGFYSILALNDAGQPNWTAPAWVAGVLLLTAGWLTLRERKPKVRVWEKPSMIAAGLVVVLLHVVIFLPLPREGKPDGLHRVRGSKALAEAVVAYARTNDTSYIIGDHYQTSAQICFYGEGHPTAYTVDDGRVNDQFDLWPSYLDQPVGSSGLFVSRNGRIPQGLEDQFEEISLIGEVAPYFGSSLIYRHVVFLCRGLKASVAGRVE
ncbi:MAG: glycosyltransferase family 39 protein [Verrucomicrobia bacterium]|nr:glycosyltransferase family 39 protein [Verrucomicrobiota bacterium]